VTSLEVKDSVDFADVSDGILIKDKVHFLNLRKHIVANELLIEEVLEGLVVRNLFVSSHSVVKEVDEDSIFTVSRAVLIVVALEVGLKLLVQI
jgi:hypothetical protein